MKGRRIAVFFCIGILAFSGCKKADSEGGTAGSVTRAQYCFTEDGLLHRQSLRGGSKIAYFDYRTRTCYPLCGDPNCLHDSRECTAIYLADTNCIGRIGDKWYYQKDSGTDAQVFYCCDLDGKNEKVLGEFPRYCTGTSLFFDHFLVAATEEWFVDEETGEVSENMKCGIYRYDLESGKEELLVPERESQLGAYCVYGCHENLLAYLELTDEAEMKYELRVMDLETKRVTEPLGDRRLWSPAPYAMSGSLLVCSVQDGGAWEVVELDIESGEWNRIWLEGQKGTADIIWSPELKLLRLYDEIEGRPCHRTWQYTEKGECVLVREDWEEYPFSPIVIKDGVIVGPYGGWDDTTGFTLAVIGTEDYLAGKSNFISLQD